MKSNKSQPWIYSPFFDSAFILAPAFIVSAIVVAAPSLLISMQAVPLWAWVVLVMGVDVSHVWSTIYRTYLDPDEMKSRRALYLMVPFLCWFVGVILYSVGALVFWRVLAYIAVFHFIRQQYGFMMIYRRNEESDQNARYIDQAVIYLATLYPLIYWHTHIPRHFSWFIDGDFVGLKLPQLESVAFVLYLVALFLYLSKEINRYIKSGNFNLPKNLILFGTILSWYIGIVAFNGDMAFTLTNVVTHGIPYIALVWAFGRKKWAHSQKEQAPAVSKIFTPKMIPFFIGALLIIAYLEEALWDGFVWREHGGFFRGWHALPDLADSSILVWLIPLLAVPQATHYVLDGFIWKIRRKESLPFFGAENI